MDDTSVGIVGKESYEQWTEHWKRLVSEWQSSGLSQAEFCRQRAIRLTTFNFWKLRVLKQAPGPVAIAGPAARAYRSRREAPMRRSSLPCPPCKTIALWLKAHLALSRCRPNRWKVATV